MTILNLNFTNMNMTQVVNRTLRSDYFKIKNLDYHYSFELKSFSYDTLTAAFYHNYLDYINMYEKECIPIELFKDISINVDKFDISLLFNNIYIHKQYLKLTVAEKEQLVQDKNLNLFFNEINSVLNFKNF